MAKKKSALASELSAAAIWPADELPFVREILAQPLDDAPRLVFADWLEERGDPRGEFIRVQCQLAKLRIRDPQYPPLEARSRALLNKYRLQWIAPYPKLAGIVWGIDQWNWSDGHDDTRHYFRRGLLSAVHCQAFGAARKTLPKLIDELGVSELKGKFSLDQARELSLMPEAARIESLLLSQMEAIKCFFLLRSPALGPIWRLDLNYNADAKAPLKVFLEREQSRALRWLSLERAKPDEMEPLLTWKHLGGLDVLDVRSDASGLVETLADSPLLRPSFLPLECGPWLERFVPWRERLAVAPAMSEVVRMSLRRIDAPQALEGLKLPPKVTALEVVGGFGNGGVAALAQAPACEQLQELRLACYNLKDAAAESLAAGTHWGRLRKLSVFSIDLTYRGAEILVDGFGRLEQLTLEGFKLTREQKAALRGKFAGELTI
jgi:uncharacterized protein (TIGR02996 family)